MSIFLQVLKSNRLPSRSSREVGHAGNCFNLPPEAGFIYGLLAERALRIFTFHEPFGQFDYDELQFATRFVISHSGAIRVESSLMGFSVFTTRGVNGTSLGSRIGLHHNDGAKGKTLGSEHHAGDLFCPASDQLAQR